MFPHVHLFEHSGPAVHVYMLIDIPSILVKQNSEDKKRTQHRRNHQHDVIIEQAHAAYHARRGTHRQVIEGHVTLEVDSSPYFGKC